MFHFYLISFFPIFNFLIFIQKFCTFSFPEEIPNYQIVINAINIMVLIYALVFHPFIYLA